MIKIKVRPISLNHAKTPMYRNGKMYYTNSAKYKRFQEEVKWHLLNHKDDFMPVFESYKPEKEGLSMEIVFGIKGLLTKQGTIRKKMLDLDNIQKTFIDCLFSFTNVDDACILHIDAKKVESEKDYISFRLRKIRLKDFTHSVD